MSPAHRLSRSFSPELLEALGEFVDERARAIADQQIRNRELELGEWVSIAVASQLSGLSAPALRERVRRGLPARKEGERLQVRLVDVQESVPAAGTVTCASR